MVVVVSADVPDKKSMALVDELRVDVDAEAAVVGGISPVLVEESLDVKPADVVVV
jgi:hypothetical protein